MKKKVYLKGHIGDKKFKVEMPQPRLSPLSQLMRKTLSKEKEEVRCECHCHCECGGYHQKDSPFYKIWSCEHCTPHPKKEEVGG